MERILIIDDSVANIKILSNILAKDYKVSICKNGKEGIKQAIEQAPILILLDIIMPEMDGFEVIKKLKSIESTKDIPVIFITSLTDDESEERGFSLGAVDYIIKPFNPIIVKARVKAHSDLYLYRKKIENLAMLDGLTGIGNRRSYDRHTDIEWKKAISKQYAFTAMLLDVDYFKQYNDYYGHLKGDEVLKNIARTVSKNLPNKSDYVCRYSGEKFIVILLGTEKEEALIIAEKLRQAVENLNIPHSQSTIAKKVTVSIGGMTKSPKEGEVLDDLIDIVDRHLYWAKGMGRNRVVWEYNRAKDHSIIEISMLGNFKITIGDKSITSTMNRSKKMWLMLQYLIVFKDKEITQQELIEVLWPGEEVEKPSYALKTLSYRLRETLQKLQVPYARELIIKSGGTYHWNKGYICRIDCNEFERLCKEADKEEITKVERLILYKKALKLYKEDFLQGTVPEQWMFSTQTYYHSLYIKALHSTLKILQEQEKYEEIHSICRSVLQKEQFDEEIHYYFIDMLIKIGKPQEALKDYKHIKEMLHKEFGSGPCEKLTELYKKINQ